MLLQSNSGPVVDGCLMLLFDVRGNVQECKLVLCRSTLFLTDISLGNIELCAPLHVFCQLVFF